LGALGAANAAGLRATADRSSPRIAGNSSDFSLVLANQGSTPLGNLRIRAPADVTIDCDGTTEGGRSFSPGGTLAAGDRVSCSGRSTTPANRARSMGFVVSAVDSQGLPQLQHVSLGGLGVTTPGQGVIVLMGGAIHNDTDVDGVLDAGETISYHYTLLNLGTLALSALAVSDLSGAVSCPQTTLAVGASLICTRTYTITASNATDGFVTNDVRVNGVDTLGLPVQGGDVLATISLAGNAGIHVFKSPLLLDDADTSGFASVGDRLRYTFVVKNSNAQTLTLVQLVEPDPTRIDTAISCAATTLGGLPFAGNGTGSLIANDVVLCTADYTIRVTDEAMGQALNLVEAGGTPAVGPRINASGASAVVIPGSFQIQVSKTANVADVFPGGTVIYTVVVSNPGSLPVANVNISDPLPAGVASFSWTCAGSSCPNASGSGGINETIPSFPAGAQVIYTVNAVLTMEPPPSILNVVTVTPPGVALCTPSNLPPPCRSTVPIRVVPFPIPAPAGSLGGWLLLSLLLGAVAAVRLRQEA
jgi:uncharacterized repeat protein (TIGR01451 family)